MIFRKLLLATAFIAAPAAFAKPPKAPAAPPLARVCAECHGQEGVALQPGVPHLNGQLPEYTVEALEKLKAGKRPSSTPEHANPELNTATMEALGNYYAFFQKASRPAQAADPAKVAAAAALYSRRCAKCHLDSGRDGDHEAPLMAGQSLEYLQAQTQAFVGGKRKFPFLMDEAYQGLSAEDLERLSHYFASQRP